MISIALEWFRTPKPISGWMDGWMGWDGIGWYPGVRRYRAPYGANNYFEGRQGLKKNPELNVLADNFFLDYTA